MKIHLSVDDVIYSLMSLVESPPYSVFDIRFFSVLKQLNEKYGAIFTLYAFENYAENFFVNDIPICYWNEMAESGFIRFGFHGTFFPVSNELFEKNVRISIPVCRNVSELKPYGYTDMQLTSLCLVY